MTAFAVLAIVAVVAYALRHDDSAPDDSVPPPRTTASGAESPASPGERRDGLRSPSPERADRARQFRVRLVQSLGTASSGVGSLPSDLGVFGVVDDGERHPIQRNGDVGTVTADSWPRSIRFECAGYLPVEQIISQDLKEEADLGTVTFHGAARIEVAVLAAENSAPAPFGVLVRSGAADAGRIVAQAELSSRNDGTKTTLSVPAATEFDAALTLSGRVFGVAGTSVRIPPVREGAVASVVFDLRDRPLVELRLAGLPQTRPAPASLEIGPTIAGPERSTAWKIRLELESNEIAYFAPSGVEPFGVHLSTLDGAVTLRETTGRRTTWSCPPVTSLLLAPSEPLVTVLIENSDGTPYVGPLAVEGLDTPVLVDANRPILARQAVLALGRLRFTTGDGLQVALAQCTIERDAADFARLRLPSAKECRRVELRWTTPEPLVRAARLFAVPRTTTLRDDRWSYGGYTSESDPASGATFSGLVPWEYLLRVEFGAGRTAVRYDVEPLIQVRSEMPTPLLVTLPRVVMATAVVNRFEEIPENHRPRMLWIENQEQGVIIDAKGHGTVIVPERSPLTARLSGNPRSMEVLLPGFLRRGTDGTWTLAFDFPAELVADPALAVAPCLHGTVVTRSVDPTALPDRISPEEHGRPAPSEGAARDVVVPGPGTARGALFYELGFENSGRAAMTFRALAIMQGATSTFVVGPNGEDATVVIPSDWGQVEIAVERTASVIGGTRSFSTALRRSANGLRLWIPAATDAVVVSAVDASGVAVHRRFRPPFPGTIRCD